MQAGIYLFKATNKHKNKVEKMLKVNNADTRTGSRIPFWWYLYG